MKPTPRSYFNLLAIIGSISWISVVIHYILNIVSLIGLISGLPQLFLGLLIVGVGNAFPGRLLCSYRRSACRDQSVWTRLSAHGYHRSILQPAIQHTRRILDLLIHQGLPSQALRQLQSSRLPLALRSSAEADNPRTLRLSNLHILHLRQSSQNQSVISCLTF